MATGYHGERFRSQGARPGRRKERRRGANSTSGGVVPLPQIGDGLGRGVRTRSIHASRTYGSDPYVSSGVTLKRKHSARQSRLIAGRFPVSAPVEADRATAGGVWSDSERARPSGGPEPSPAAEWEKDGGRATMTSHSARTSLAGCLGNRDQPTREAVRETEFLRSGQPWDPSVGSTGLPASVR